MAIPESLLLAVTSPTPESLQALRGDLLEAGVPGQARVHPVVAEFHAYLDALRTGATARDYSNLASKLDISAVGGVVLEHIAEPARAKELALRVFSAIISEGLMALATRQHVKAWAEELAAVHRRAAWFLYDDLWSWTAERKPELAAAERRRLLDRLVAPLSDPDGAGESKALLAIRLFQMLLLGRVAPELARLKDSA